MKPTRFQWLVLWVGTLWTLGALVVADEYVGRAVFAGLLVTALLYWQLAPSNREFKPDQTPRPLDADAPKDHPQPAAPHKVTPEMVRPAPVGVGGWLAFFNLGVVLTPLIVLLTAAESVTGAESFVEAFITLVILGGFAGYSAYVSIGLLKHWPSAPRSAVIYLLIVVFLSLMGEAAETSSQAPSNVGGVLLYGLIWGFYFKNSKRVRATYDSASSPASRTVPRLTAASIGLLVVLIGVMRFSYIESEVAAFEKLTPFEYVKSGRALSKTFDREYVDSWIAEQKNSFESMEPAGAAEFVQLRDLIRGELAMIGQMKLDNGSLARVNVITRQYFHSNGMAVLQSLCIPEFSDCDTLKELLDDAEAAVLQRLSDLDLVGILPDGDCSVETSGSVNGVDTQTIACGYSDQGGAAITLTKLSLDQSQSALLHKGLSRKIKRDMVLAARR